MGVTVELVGLNLERLLNRAAQAGIVIRSARRMQPRVMRVRISRAQRSALQALCASCGWEMREISPGWLGRALTLGRRRPMLLPAAALFVGLTLLSSRLMWCVRIEHAGKEIGEVRMLLSAEGILPGRPKGTISVSQLRERLLLRLPDLAYAGIRFAGSTLVIDCRPALEGETVLSGGQQLDLVAAQDAVITRLAVQSGTPEVKVGQAVRAGDVLIRGEERGEKGTVHPVQAQGEVLARVWARGDARVARTQQRTVETGLTRRRVTLCTPWSRRVVVDAQPFDAQDASVQVQPLVGLFVPVWREIETLAEIEVVREPRSDADAASIAQGAAEKMAKLGCPTGAEILDKWVDYSMIDDEFVYATVVLEYEQSIAVRADAVQEGN